MTLPIYEAGGAVVAIGYDLAPWGKALLLKIQFYCVTPLLCNCVSFSISILSFIENVLIATVITLRILADRIPYWVALDYENK